MPRSFPQRCAIALFREYSVHSSIDRVTSSFKFFRTSHTEVMQTIKLTVLVFVLVARLCRAEVVIASLSPEQSTSHFVEALATIVTSCYEGRIDGIGYAGDLPDDLLKTLSSQYSIPVVLINTVEVEDQLPEERPEFPHKLPIFIVGVHSSEHLRKIVNLNMKFSMWWNHLASFIIIHRLPECKYAGQFLTDAWILGVLNAKVMCSMKSRNSDESMTLITDSNPFTDFAPVPWQKITIYEGKHGHPFTVFGRLFRRNKDICVNFNFDKVKDCGGHWVMMDSRWSSVEAIALQKINRNRKGIVLTTERILSSVYSVLNLTPKVATENGVQHIEMLALPLSLLYSSETQTYPHAESALVILSQFRGNKSFLNKILSIVGVNLWIGLVVTYLVILIFLKFFSRQALVPAILNLIRITLGSRFANVPRSDALRIYLVSVFFFSATMHGIFEGNLPSLLTKVIPHRNIDTLQELLDFNYTIYGHAHVEFMRGSKVMHRYTRIHLLNDCITKVREDKTSACIFWLHEPSLDPTLLIDLHVSRKVMTAHIAFGVASDWPYEERFNIILSRLVEADVLKPWDVRCHPVKMENFQIDQKAKQNKDFKKIALGELLFAFAILGIGLLLASVTCVIEVKTAYKCGCICRVSAKTRDFQRIYDRAFFGPATIRRTIKKLPKNGATTSRLS